MLYQTKRYLYAWCILFALAMKLLNIVINVT